jgi:hypothetical protein
MKKRCLLLAVLLLPVACATVDRPAPDIDTDPAATEKTTPAVADAESEAGESLLVYRASLCAGAAAERQRQLASPRDEADHRQQFQRLLLASCDPWQHREELRQALEAASLKQDWSEDERAFLRLMESHQESLRQQMQETIRGISEIEDAIEGRPDRESLARELKP